MLAPTAETAPRQSFADRRLLVVLAAASIACVLLYTHTSDINGPWYWKWHWKFVPWRRYWVMLPAALPFAAAQFFKTRRSIALCLLLLCAIQLRLTFALLQDEHFRLDWLAATVRNPVTVSYYSDAAAIGRDAQWLADYPQILPLTNLHTQSKPPGPVAYYLAWIRLLGYGDRSAKASGLGVLVLESLVVPLVYCLASSLAQDSEIGFAAASFISLCPGAVLIVPMLDPLYAAWTCLILLAWNRTLRSGAGSTTSPSRAVSARSPSQAAAKPSLSNLAWAGLCGIVFAAGAFCSYCVLTLALFAAIQALVISRPARPLLVLPRLILAAAAGCAIFYGVLWASTFFDPIATFRSAWHNQHMLLFRYRDQRPYPATILFDLSDFALGMGWVGAAIVVMGACRAAYDRSLGSGRRWLLVACVVQPLVIAVAGLMQSETFRVWNFMLPLAAIAAGFELTRWTLRARALAYAAMFIAMLAIGQNLHFL
jgi:hypothetical protein